MTNGQTLSAKYRQFLVFFLALCLGLMLSVLVKERLSNPSLTTVRTSNAHFQANQDMIPHDMDEIGAMMQMLRSHPDDLQLMLKLVDALMQQGSFEAAEQFAKRVLNKDQNNFRAHFLLGIILHQRSAEQEAAEHLLKALSINDDAPTRYSLGILNLYFLNNKEEGQKHLLAGLQCANLTPELKGNIEEELKNLQKAESAAKAEETKQQKEQKPSQKRDK
ncbi:MAG: tetratricopeptide repeat protein [Desulfovibrio sp.]|nr:tetratricopeptide repeat protein [Desulfovibrio sp.]